MKRSIQSRTLGLFTIAIALGAFAPPVDARTVPASAGKATSGFQEENMSASNGGAVFKVGGEATGSVFWVVPVVFDFSGARTISVHGMCPSSGLPISQLTCRAYALKKDGTLASQSASASFPQNNTYTTINLSLSSVPAGAVGGVTCQFQGAQTCMLLGADYVP